MFISKIRSFPSWIFSFEINSQIDRARQYRAILLRHLKIGMGKLEAVPRFSAMATGRVENMTTGGFTSRRNFLKTTVAGGTVAAVA
jgi:hypothetical protein